MRVWLALLLSACVWSAVVADENELGRRAGVLSGSLSLSVASSSNTAGNDESLQLGETSEACEIHKDSTIKELTHKLAHEKRRTQRMLSKKAGQTEVHELGVANHNWELEHTMHKERADKARARELSKELGETKKKVPLYKDCKAVTQFKHKDKSDAKTCANSVKLCASSSAIQKSCVKTCACGVAAGEKKGGKKKDAAEKKATTLTKAAAKAAGAVGKKSTDKAVPKAVTTTAKAVPKAANTTATTLAVIDSALLAKFNKAYGLATKVFKTKYNRAKGKKTKEDCNLYLRKDDSATIAGPTNVAKFCTGAKKFMSKTLVRPVLTSNSSGWIPSPKASCAKDAYRSKISTADFEDSMFIGIKMMCCNAAKCITKKICNKPSGPQSDPCVSL